MKNTFIIYCILFSLILSCSPKDRTTQYNIDLFFDKLDVITVDSSFYEGIKYLDVNDIGDLLITNDIRSDVLIYDSLGILKERLSVVVDSLFPGFNWKPNKALFTKNGDIFISNNGPWGALLSKEMDSFTPLKSTYIAGADITFDDDENIFSFNSNNLGIFIIKYSKDGEILAPRFGEYPKKFENIIDKAIIGNSLVSSGNYLFFKTIAEPNIFKYDLDGKLIDEFKHVPNYYRPPVNDIRKEPLTTMVSDIRTFAEKYTANYSIHTLNDSLLLVQYSNYNYEYGIQLLTFDGVEVLPNDLLINYKVMATQDDNIYLMDIRDYNFNSNYIPQIFKYQLKKEYLR